MLESVLKESQLKDTDIVIKCKKYPQFKKQLQEIENNYQNDLKMSHKALLPKYKDMVPFEILKRSKLYLLFYACRMSHFKEDDFRELYLYWINKMNPYCNDLKVRYTIVFLNCQCSSLSPYLFIKESFKKLPIQYYALLDQIYMAETSFLIRNNSLLEFSRLHKLYFRKITFVESVKELSLVKEIQQDQVLDTVSEFLPKKEGKGCIVATPLRKQEKKDFFTVTLDQHTLDENNIPVCVSILIETLRANPDMMQLQGIFRKSGSIEEEDQIIAQLSKMEKVEVLSMPETGAYSGYAIASVIKKFFYKLTKPIVPYGVYKWIMGVKQIKEQQQMEFVIEILNYLPPLNLSIILHVIKFIRNEVLQFKEQNKMSYYNMSVVFSPCFFRPETETFQDLLNSGRFSSILNILYSHFDDIVSHTQLKERALSPSKARGSKGSKGSRGSKGSKGSRGSNKRQASLQPINTNN